VSVVRVYSKLGASISHPPWQALTYLLCPAWISWWIMVAVWLCPLVDEVEDVCGCEPVVGVVVMCLNDVVVYGSHGVVGPLVLYACVKLRQ
jgi:hypothetical protein